MTSSLQTSPSRGNQFIGRTAHTLEDDGRCQRCRIPLSAHLFASPSLLSTGWSLLNSLADFPHDFLLPAQVRTVEAASDKSYFTTSVSPCSNVCSQPCGSGHQLLLSGLRIQPGLVYPLRPLEYLRIKETTSEVGARKRPTQISKDLSSPPCRARQRTLFAETETVGLLDSVQNRLSNSSRRRRRTGDRQGRREC